jgi:Ser/Thr protein kinase RdoA (MazF antagonist)
VAVDGFDVSGFIDCDHMSLAPRIFDLADFLVHLIKWDVGNAQEEATWLANIRQLIAGYESVSPLTAPEHQALYYALLGIPIVFMDFFLQANLPEPVKVELALFSWLAQHRAEIVAQLKTN